METKIGGINIVQSKAYEYLGVKVDTNLNYARQSIIEN